MCFIKIIIFFCFITLSYSSGTDENENVKYTPWTNTPTHYNRYPPAGGDLIRNLQKALKNPETIALIDYDGVIANGGHYDGPRHRRFDDEGNWLPRAKGFMQAFSDIRKKYPGRVYIYSAGTSFITEAHYWCDPLPEGVINPQELSNGLFYYPGLECFYKDPDTTLKLNMYKGESFPCLVAFLRGCRINVKRVFFIDDQAWNAYAITCYAVQAAVVVHSAWWPVEEGTTNDENNNSASTE